MHAAQAPPAGTAGAGAAGAGAADAAGVDAAHRKASATGAAAIPSAPNGGRPVVNANIEDPGPANEAETAGCWCFSRRK
jgi:hypothetical protein